MKKLRITAFVLAALTLALTACSGSGSLLETAETAAAPASTAETAETGEVMRVWTPMKEAPLYTLAPGASTDEIRAMAVQAMRDELSVQWYVDKSFSYSNKNGQDMPVNAGEVYAGLPYTQSASGLFQWLQYYDFETGRMANISGDLQGWLGNSCAASVIWGHYAVTTSTQAYTTFTMTPVNGYLPVGGYKLDPSIANYKDHNTEQIIAENGEKAMLAAYAAVLPADALLSYKEDGATTGHAQMAIEPAHVEYGADGSIDPNASYIMIQDQHKGQTSNSEPFVTELEGNRVHYAGHVSLKMTFAKLLKDCYIPLTTAEFTGAKAYTAPTAQAIGAENVTGPEDLKNVTISSPYTIAVIRACVKDGDKVEVESRKMIGSSDLSAGVGRNFDMKNFSLLALARKREAGKEYRLTVDVQLACGEIITVVDIPFTYA